MSASKPTTKHPRWRRMPSAAYDGAQATRGGGPLRTALRLATAVGLAVDAYVHWHLAPTFDPVMGTGSPAVSQGQLFRVEAVMAALAMLLVLFVDRQVSVAFAFLVAAGGAAAVLFYAFVDPGDIGPLPGMYDPSWYPEKTASLIAEGVAAITALVALGLPRRARAAGTT